MDTDNGSTLTPVKSTTEHLTIPELLGGVKSYDHLPIENQILAAMTRAEYQRLAPHLEQVELEVGQALYKANEPIIHVYFPHQSIVSLVCIQKDGSTVEAGIEGNDGIVGVSATKLR
ncbi:Crp/Fnr family transcriptional regulator [Nostocales cyanobacterium LEGE 12452]|nr:Crp/Fnr family transcriptional regulator [Nostocales cyanobacterium LEGE 12452]